MTKSITATRKPRVSAVLSLCILGGVATVADALWVRPAGAEQPAVNLDVGQGARFDLAQASGGPAPLAIVPAQPTPPAYLNPYAKADDLRIRGYNIALPGALDTLDQGLFGVRNAAADVGIGYLEISGNTFAYNLLHHGLPAPNFFGPAARNNQLYSGQLPTYTVQNTLYMTYDLRRFGIPDGQITVAGQLLTTNWNPGGPDLLSLATATYYQTIFNRLLEVKVGYLNDALEFIGPNVGNSLANGVFGPNASLSIENGLDASPFTTLGTNIKLNVPTGLPGNVYDKLGISRGINPDGTVNEKLQNPTSLSLTVHNAGLNVIDEVGYRIYAAPGQYQMWLRADANYTSSRYALVNEPAVRDSPNFGLYLLADRQLLQTAPGAGPGSAVRGIYAGFSVEYAPSYFNRFSQYYEARVYGFGLVPGRPYDLASIVATRNVFSEDAVRFARAAHMLAHENTNAGTISYGARIIPGLNWNNALQYTDHPTVVTYTGNTGSAFTFLSNILIFL